MVLGRSLALAADRVLAPIEGMHSTISHRWFSAAGHPGGAVRRAHDAVLSGVYGSVRIGAAALGTVVSHRVSSDSQISLKGQAIVNGLWGDDLGSYEDDVEIPMAVRSANGDMAADGSPLTVAPPDATPHLVVLVHGLFESEFCWDGGEDSPGLAEELQKRSHLTVLTVRYNSGRRISDNGNQLARRLEALCEGWPVPIESIALVGNSMGGLVIRSSCATAEQENHEWLTNVGDIVTVATPHHGTPIESGVSALSSALSLVDSTKPLASFLESRSRGIRDLRHGSIADHDDQRSRSIDHHFIAVVVTPEPGSRLGEVIGDLVVRPTSAAMGAFRPSMNVTHVGGTNHFNALSNASVIDSVLNSLDRRH